MLFSALNRYIVFGWTIFTHDPFPKDKFSNELEDGNKLEQITPLLAQG